MPRARLISPEFWTAEAVVDCAPMTRLLLLGLSNFADDFGVLPLRPRTIRLQVFPGDALDDEAVRAMLEALATRGLLRRYTVEGVEYLSIVHWQVHQRVSRRARRRYPAEPSRMTPIETAPSDSEADQGFTDSAPPSDNRNPVKEPPSDEASDAAWRDAVERAVRGAWGADVPGDVALHAARWRAQGRDLTQEVLPAIERVIAVAVEFKQPLRLGLVDRAMAGSPPPAAMAQTREDHRSLAA